MNLRVKFTKHGAIVYIGHLDVMRYFQKVIRRAQIDVAYTGGFSPHQVMTFAQPLGVGIESEAEYMDIKVNSMSSTQDIMDALNNASVPEVRITNVIVLPEDAGNAMASVFAASYVVGFREGKEPEFLKKNDAELADMVCAFRSRAVIPYQKETKKGIRELNLRDGLYEMEYLPEQKAFSMTLNASSAGNIKPGQILEVLYREFGEEMKPNALFITRKEIYVNAGDEEHIRLLPMDQVGQADEQEN